MKKSPAKIIYLAIALATLASLWLLCMRHLDFGTIQTLTLKMQSAASAHRVITFLVLLVIQAVGMFFTLPTKAIFNMVGGALLGFIPSAVMIMLGTLLGTTGLFFATQKIVTQDTLEKLPRQLKKFEKKLQNRPTLTVASLRLILALPYGAITIFCAVTRIPYRAFLTGSLLGDIPVILLYSFAGLKLAELAGTGEAVSPATIIALSLAGVGLFAGSLWPSKKERQSA